ncbi:MAG: hypothetical protein ABL998_04045 [Planctomycetota bacterium]
MHMNRAAPFLLLSVACHDGSDGAASLPAPLVTNLGVPVQELTGEDELWLLCVSEEEAGGADKNGDGDALDFVAHALDLRTGSVTNLGHAMTRPPFLNWHVGGGMAGFGVSEVDEGQDLNGDGDLLDQGAFLFDPTTGTARDLGISCVAFEHLHEDFAVLLVSETDEGVDMDGDGQLFSLFSHVVELGSGTIVPLGVRSVSAALGPWIVFLRSEFDEQVDLNADGDLSDGVAHLHHLPTGTETNLAVAVRAQVFTGGELFVVPVFEPDQGGTDLNGDGDGNDLVVHVLDPLAGALVNTGLGGSGRDGQSPAGASLGAYVLLFTNEADGRDRNLDGDTSDVLPVLYPRAGGRILEPGVAVNPFGGGASPVGGLLAIAVSEAQENRDLDADGDLDDILAHTFEPALERLRNLGHPALVPLSVTASRWIEAGSFEPNEGRDLNGDGDQDDYVPSFLDVASGRAFSTRLQTSGFSVARLGDRALFVTRDPELPSFGLAYSVYDLRSRRERPLGLHSGFDGRVRSVGEERALFTVSELYQGADLDGDGDALDDVLFLLE